METLRHTAPGPPASTLAAVGEAAELWGAEWDGASGVVHLPVAAGLRHGEIRGRLSLTPAGTGTQLVLAVEEEAYRVHTPAVAILLIACLGALSVMLWPFFPALGPVAPLGAILALSGWFLVLSKLHSRNAREFLELVERIGTGGEEPERPG